MFTLYLKVDKWYMCRYLLEWVEMALCSAAAAKSTGDEDADHLPGMISNTNFWLILRQMKKSAVR